jgi:hypothetical protein
LYNINLDIYNFIKIYLVLPSNVPREYRLYMCKLKFDAAGFLDHHWFKNGLYGDLGYLAREKALPPYRINCLDSQVVFERLALFHESGRLNEALSDVPEDIMLFLSRYSFAAKELGEKLTKEEFLRYY